METVCEGQTGYRIKKEELFKEDCDSLSPYLSPSDSIGPSSSEHNRSVVVTKSSDIRNGVTPRLFCVSLFRDHPHRLTTHLSLQSPISIHPTLHPSSTMFTSVVIGVKRRRGGGSGSTEKQPMLFSIQRPYRSLSPPRSLSLPPSPVCLPLSRL